MDDDTPLTNSLTVRQALKYACLTGSRYSTKVLQGPDIQKGYICLDASPNILTLVPILYLLIYWSSWLF